MANSGPNPVLMIRDHLPEHVADLKEQLSKAVAEVRKIQAELIEAQTYLAVAQDSVKPTPQVETETRKHRRDNTTGGTIEEKELARLDP